jgi:ATP-dependent RNA helicase DeaD
METNLTASADHSPSPAGFDRFGLHPSLLRGTQAAGFETPRPIQAAAIPAGLDGRDVLGLAQTGTGKTAAFALPLLQRILDTGRRGPQALVLAPTRELANQIDAEIRELAQ